MTIQHLAMEPGTLILPHRHPYPWEVLTVLKERFTGLVFDEAGSVSRPGGISRARATASRASTRPPRRRNTPRCGGRLIEPLHLKADNGRPPIGIERMLRIYFLQNWFELSDSAVQKALYDSLSIRDFFGIDLGGKVRYTKPSSRSCIRVTKIASAAGFLSVNFGKLYGKLRQLFVSTPSKESTSKWHKVNM